MPKPNIQDFEEEAQRIVSLSLAICEGVSANCTDHQQTKALCAATISLQEAVKMFIALAKAI